MGFIDFYSRLNHHQYLFITIPIQENSRARLGGGGRIDICQYGAKSPIKIVTD